MGSHLAKDFISDDSHSKGEGRGESDLRNREPTISSVRRWPMICWHQVSESRSARSYLLTGAKAKALKLRAETPTVLGGDGPGGTTTEPLQPQIPVEVAPTSAGRQQIRIVGAVPPEVWNRLGTKLIPKLKAGVNLKLGLSFTL